MVSLDMIYEAREGLRGVATVTPVVHATKISDNLYFKAENLQETGAFKLRGAYNKISHLTAEEAAKGVVACSAGNHAQGIALSATRRGIRSVICMPASVPLAKLEATRAYGGEVVLVQGVYDDAAAEAARLQAEEGLTFAHPFNDPYVIAGQGTIGMELLEQMPEVEAVIVSIGGGGLISGIACAIKSLKPSCKIYGVQAENAASMYRSVREGKLVTLDSAQTIADGIAVKTPGDLTYDLVQKYVDGVVTVSEDEIAAAMLTMIEQQKTVAEGAGAATVAAFLFNKIEGLAGKKVCCVVSGGNIDVGTLSRVMNRGLVKSGRICEFHATLQDKPGELNRLLTVVSREGANVMTIEHGREMQRLEIGYCGVKLVVETRNEAHRDSLISALKASDFKLS